MHAKDAAKMLGGPVVVMAALSGCGGALSLVLKPPIVERCQDAGLRGCSDLADGVIEYAAGDRDEAKAKLKTGAAANAPDKLREFAAKLRMLKSIPGASEHMGPILEVADLLAGGPAAPALAADAPMKTAASSGPTVVVADPALVDYRGDERGDHQPAAAQTVAPGAVQAAAVANGLRAGSVVPAVALDAHKCDLLFNTKPGPEPGTAWCVVLGTGPLVVTDMQTSGGCSNTLVLGAGTPVAPTWFLLALPGAPFAVHGASYQVKSAQPLFAAQISTGEPRHDSRCAITWGVRGAAAEIESAAPF